MSGTNVLGCDAGAWEFMDAWELIEEARMALLRAQYTKAPEVRAAKIREAKEWLSKAEAKQ